MNRIFNSTIAIVLSLSLVLSFSVFFSSADSVSTSAGVDTKMCKSSYWYDYTVGDKDRVLMTSEEIDTFNYNTQQGSGTGTIDISSFYSGTYNADKKRLNLSDYSNATSFRTDHSSFYMNGETYNDKTGYLKGILDQVKNTGYTDTEKEYQYAVGIKRTALLSFPLSYEMGWSSKDADDENQIGSIDVNEPVVIIQYALVDDNEFYYVRGDNLGGWVKCSDIAICKDKEEWLDAWQVETSAKDFIVVTQNKIILDKSHMNPDISEVKLTLGTILKLVPDEEKASVGERGLWHNYAVYLPTRDSDGMYVKKMALISQHYSVSVGYLPYTQRNCLDLAFACIGDRYGWGGSDDAMDCSQYTRTIYKCMGFQLPRNTTMQLKSKGVTVNMASKTDSEKVKFLSTCPAGSCLYFSSEYPAHTMMYTGTVDETNYCISNTGTLYDTDGKYYQQYNIILNPLTVKRSNGTWLSNTQWVVIPQGKIDISNAVVSVKNSEVTVTYEGTKLYEGLNYTVSENDGVKTITGIYNFTGSKNVNVSGITNVKLSHSKYVYNGKVKNPSVKVYSGDTLLSADDYTITREADTRLPGKYEITVKGKNNAKGTFKTSYTIYVKETGINSLKSYDDAFYVKCNQISSTYITGYQVRYSTSKSMSSYVTKTIGTSSSSISKKITGLKSNKTYYVKVRTYKKIDGKAYYSNWSDIKSVKTK